MSFLGGKVNAVLAVKEDVVAKNIQENLDNIPTWFGDMFYPNGFEAFIISGGPSMEKYVAELNLPARMKQENRSFVIFCVKHALPRLQAMGVDPDFCVLLDGRPLDDYSTHGVHRKSLFNTITDNTIFMCASMAHPDYGKYLMSRGARVLGWHTSVTGIEKFRDSGRIIEPIISGGTSSGTRCISIAHSIGIREITLIGFDSCTNGITDEMLQEKDSKGRQKYMPVELPICGPVVTPEEQKMVDTLYKSLDDRGMVLKPSVDKRFFTTGELLAQAQDFEKLFGDTNSDIRFKVFDDGIANHMFHHMPNVPKRGFSFIEYMKRICPRQNTEDFPRRTVVLP